jgi:hypothetical protein
MTLRPARGLVSHDGSRRDSIAAPYFILKILHGATLAERAIHP